MGVSAIYGLPGRGKSLFSTYIALTLADKYRKKIVTNFPLKPLELAEYCRFMGLKWVSENLGKGIIFYVHIPLNDKKGICEILAIPDSIILLDECGVYLPARGSTYNTPQELLDGLCQVRHERQYLFYIAQSEKQVDSALRNLTEEVFHAHGNVKYSPALGNDELVWKQVFRFLPESFTIFQNDSKIRGNPFKCFILANFKGWVGPLSCADIYSFRIYDSFAKLSDQAITQDESAPLRYRKYKDKPRWVLVGDNPSEPHHFSWLVSKLMKILPYPFLRLILRLDAKLAQFKGFNKLEKFIIKVVAGYFALFAITWVLP